MIGLHAFEPDAPPPELKEMKLVHIQEYRIIAMNEILGGSKKTPMSHVINIARRNIKKLRSLGKHGISFLYANTADPIVAGYLLLRYGTPEQQATMNVGFRRPKNWEGKCGELKIGDRVECLVPMQFLDQKVEAGYQLTIESEDICQAMNMYRAYYKKL